MPGLTVGGSLRRRVARACCVGAFLLASVGPVLAADVMRPEAIGTLLGAHIGGDVELVWDPVTLDVAGNSENIASYNVYRGTSPDFVPDKAGGSNRIGTSLDASYLDSGAAGGADTFFYKITAVDTSGNESDTRPSKIHTPPVLSGYWTGSTIELEWTNGAPLAEIVSYRLYHGAATRSYDAVIDVGLATLHSLTGQPTFANRYIAVTAVDADGNETPLSNEHIDSPNGSVLLRAHDGDELCWGAAGCTPADATKIQRRDGWQLLVPTQFPEGDWTKILVNFEIESRLCTPPAEGTVTKCGSGNPCVSPPCNGGYNPCGDPWDRTAQLFLVLDDCVDVGGNCMTNENLELIHAVTPFGTDAPPPDGAGQIGKRRLTMDITPFASLLSGNRYVGVDIAHFVQKGWWVTVDFYFTESPGQASPKPPADGIEIIGFGGAPLPTRQVTIPETATDVKMRLFTTGHGGTTFCDGGSNNANPCTSSLQCPGGVCNPCDEFCHRLNRISANGAPIWEETPWRTDCSPGGTGCTTWNACGYPSCTYPRAGWCPGYIACHHNAPCDNDLDFTPDLAPGGTYDIDYDVVPQNGSWSISLVMYWYE